MIADPEDVAEEDVGGRRGKTMVVAEEQDAETEAGSQHDPDGGVAFVFAHAEDSYEGGDDSGAAERAGDRVAGHQEPRGGAGEGELTGAVHGEGHAARDDEGSDESAGDGHQGAREQGVLCERQLQIGAQAHVMRACSRWWVWPSGSV
jgi:hypothetical protein